MILPMIIQQVLAISVSTINSVMIARAGEAAISGILLVGSLDAVLVIAFSSLVTGGTVTISHAVSHGNKSYARECVKQLFYVSTGIALVIAVAVGIFREPMLNALYGSAEASVLEHANDYLAVMVISFPFLAIYSSGVAVFRVMGNTVIAMWLSFGASVLNVVCNLLFISTLHMGAEGAALSTLIGRILSAVIITGLLCNRRNEIYLEKLFYYRPDWGVIKKMLRIGVPHGVESSMFEFGRLVTQVLISTLGTTVIAANSVANTLASYLYLPSNAIDNAVITVVGRCYGAREVEQVKKYSRMLLLWAYICMWVVSGVLILFGKPIVGLYNLTETGTEIVLKLTVFHCICTSLIRPLGFTLPSVFKATGDVKFTMVVSTVSMWVVRIGLAYILALENISILGMSIPGLGMGIMGVWVAMVIDWGIRALLYSARYVKGTWLKPI